MAPAFILGRFNPVWPAVLTAIFGVATVALLWFVAKEFFGWQIAAMVSLLWATSHQIVLSDKVLWEPNIIPFFIFLYVISLYKKWDIIGGIALGILVQLHYPNLIFIGLTFLYGIRRGIGLGFLLALSPFIFYESQHGFEDIVGVLTNFSSGGGERRFFANILDYSNRVMHRLAPVSGAFFVLFLPLLFKPTFWKLFFGVWLIVGLSAVASYRGVVFDHYLFFLLPVPFFIAGYLLGSIKKYAWIAWGIVAYIVFFNISVLRVQEKRYDISRTGEAVNTITKLADGKPFSFALVSSRSFSDLHYRYFFKIKGIEPETVKDETYDTLFLVCEQPECNLEKQEKIRVICYEDTCSGDYPLIYFDEWKFESPLSLPTGSRIWKLGRKYVELK